MFIFGYEVHSNLFVGGSHHGFGTMIGFSASETLIRQESQVFGDCFDLTPKLF
jgi:hypothetical protein